MKYFFSASFVLIALTFCASREPGTVLVKGTPDYELAEKLAKVAPVFDPVSNKVLVKTNRFDVTIGDVVTKLRSNFGKQADDLNQQPADKLTKLASEMAENTAMTRIAMLEAEKKGINVSEAEIDSLIKKQSESAGGEEQFNNFLSANGISTEILRRDLKEYETMKRYLQNLRDVAVSDAEIDSAFNQDKTATVRHILLMTKGKSEEEKKQKHEEMENLLKRARGGEDFAELAKKYSEDPGSKDKGGIYVDFPRGQMVPEFDKAAFTVPVGEISDIVETEYGYHILQIVDRKKEQRPRDQVIADIKAKKSKDIVEQKYENLKKEYELEVINIS